MVQWPFLRKLVVFFASFCLVNYLGSSHCKANIAPVHHGIKFKTTDTRINSIQFWRHGWALPHHPKIPLSTNSDLRPKESSASFVSGYVPHSIGTRADLCGIRPPRSSGTRLRGCSGPGHIPQLFGPLSFFCM